MATSTFNSDVYHNVFQNEPLMKRLQRDMPAAQFSEVLAGTYKVTLLELPEEPDITHVSVIDSKGSVRFQNSYNLQETMSNKFLPFIVESSSPLNVFKTLLSRSKGMNRPLIATIFNITLNVDIQKMRQFAKELDEMPLEKLYEEMAAKWDKYRMPSWKLTLFQEFQVWLKEPLPWNEKLYEFNDLDVLMFLCVMVHTRHDELKEYTDIDWLPALDLELLENIPRHMKLADNGQEIRLKDQTEVTAFLVYHSTIYPQLPDARPLPTYCLKLTGEK